MKNVLRSLADKIVIEVFYFIFSLLRQTWKLEEEPLPEIVQKRYSERKIVVFGHFHEDDWPMIAFYFRRQMIVMVSLSKDGSLLSGFLKRIGFLVSRGSSSRGAVAGFKQLVQLSKNSFVLNVSLAVDGPRGPRREFKKGILKLAQLMNSPIVFAKAEVDRAWILNSWAKTVIPKPFARLKLRYKVLLTSNEIEKFLDSGKLDEALGSLNSKSQF